MSGIISPFGYVAFLAVSFFTQTFIAGGVLSVFISSIERRFQLSSTQSGIIILSFDFGICASTIILPYLMRKSHRPRMVAFGSIGLSIGCLIFALPHYLTGPYVYSNSTNNDLCNLHRHNATDSDSLVPSTGKYNMMLMMLGLAVIGASCVPSHTIGLTFIEDNLAKHTTSLCIGIVNAMYLFGMTGGFVAGGKLTALYVDFDKVSQVELVDSDRRWVGAWWLLFLAAPVFIVFFSSFPMLLFPKNFKTTRIQNMENGTAIKSSTKHSLLADIWHILHNKILVLISVTATLDMCCAVGFVMFLPKIIQHQFNVTGQTAAMLTGLITVPAGVIGNITSGIIIKKYNMTVKQMLKLCVLACIPGIVFLAVAFIMKCPENIMVADDIGRNDSSISITQQLSSQCAESCNCKDDYSPVCGDDGVIYLSPCVAGCERYDQLNKTFTDCRCISSETKTASEKTCTSTCVELHIFTVLLFTGVFIMTLSYSPMLVCSMRVIEERHRPLSLGIQNFVMRLLGSLPGPVIMGLLIDQTCIFWQGGGHGSCWLYDKTKLSLYAVLFVNILATPIKLVSAFTIFLAFYLHRPTKIKVTEKKEKGLICDENL